ASIVRQLLREPPAVHPLQQERPLPRHHRHPVRAFALLFVQNGVDRIKLLFVPERHRQGPLGSEPDGHRHAPVHPAALALPAPAAAGFRKIPVPVRPVLSRPRGRRRRPAPRRPGTPARLLRPPPPRLPRPPRPPAPSGPPQLLRLRLLRQGLLMPFPVARAPGILLRPPVGSWPRKAHQHPLPVGAPLVGRGKERLRAGSRPPRGRGGLAAGAAALTRRPGLTVLLR